MNTEEKNRRKQLKKSYVGTMSEKDKQEWEESILKDDYQDILQTEDCYTVVPKEEKQ